MIDFIDKTTDQNGTPLNRANLMGVQGFEASTTTFKSDGSIEEVNAQGHKLITKFNSDGTIEEKFSGEKTITLVTKFNSDGSILGVLK